MPLGHGAFFYLPSLSIFPPPQACSLFSSVFLDACPRAFPFSSFFCSLSFAFSSFRSIRRLLCGTRRTSTTSTSAEHLPVPVACETFLAVALTPRRTHRWKPRALPLVRTSRGRSLLPRHRRRTPHRRSLRHLSSFIRQLSFMLSLDSAESLALPFRNEPIRAWKTTGHLGRPRGPSMAQAPLSLSAALHR